MIRSYNKKKAFFELMGCMTATIAFIAIGEITITLSHQFKSNVAPWPIISNFLNILAILVLGSGLTLQFFVTAKYVSK